MWARHTLVWHAADACMPPGNVESKCGSWGWQHLWQSSQSDHIPSWVVITSTVAWHVITSAVLWRRVILCTVERPNYDYSIYPPPSPPSLPLYTITDFRYCLRYLLRAQLPWWGKALWFTRAAGSKSKHQTTSHWNWMHFLVLLYGCYKKWIFPSRIYY